MATFGPRQLGSTDTFAEDNGDVLTLVRRTRGKTIELRVNRGRRDLEVRHGSARPARIPYEQIRALDVTIRGFSLRRLVVAAADFAVEARSGDRFVICTGSAQGVLAARAMVASAMGLSLAKERQVRADHAPLAFNSVRPPEAPPELADQVYVRQLMREGSTQLGQSYAAAWADLRLRQLAAIYLFFLGVLAGAVGVVFAASAGFTFAPIFVVTPVCCFFAADLWRLSFRCPCCKNEFFVTGPSRDAFAKHCTACGLPRGALEDPHHRA